MITAKDPGGKKTSLYSLIHTVGLLPLTVAIFIWGDARWVFLAGGVVLAFFYLRPAITFFREPKDETARPLFLMSLIYLPALYLVAILDRLIF
jgi:protoheme IX farnesyltransferase